MTSAPKTIEQRVASAHENLEKLWKVSADQKHSSEELCRTKWDSWSPSVRADFLNRGKKAINALVQREFPKKQWAQWEITVKFCVDDVLKVALSKKDLKWDDGLGVVIKQIVDRKESEIDPKGFQDKIQTMLNEMKAQKVENIANGSEDEHVKALKNIRSIFSSEWAIYILSKLSADN